MRIGIYNGPSGGSLGGCESSIAWLARAAVQAGHSAEVVHHQPWLSAGDLAAFAATSLDGVAFRYVPVRPQPWGESWMPNKRLEEARQYGFDVSSGYDVFFALVHGVPPFNHSPRGILHVLFPLMHRSGRPSLFASPKQTARALYTAREWRRRLASYQTLTANSSYTAGWCRTFWDIEPSVLYPPVDATFPVAGKQPSIISIGRYTRKGNAKRQDVLVTAFKSLAQLNDGASLVLLGSVSEDPDDQSYCAELQRAAAGLPVRLSANAPRAAIAQAFAEASIYWHAAGFGEAPDLHPERMEHFGISTVEAMAAGCVPVVINRGGQPEIVEHGVSGFVWERVDELVTYTHRLLGDETLRRTMSEAARVRAQRFSVERFSRDAIDLFERPLSSSCAPVPVAQSRLAP